MFVSQDGFNQKGTFKHTLIQLPLQAASSRGQRVTYEARHGTVEVVDDTWISTSEILHSIPGKRGVMVAVCML